MALQIRRGDSTELLPDSPYPGIKLAEGELVYTRDTQKLYIGDGTTFGGIDLLANISGAVSKVNNKDGNVVLTTDDIAEGTEQADRKYYTAAKAISAVATELIDNNNLHSGIEFSLDSTNLVATVTGEVAFAVQQDVAPKLGGDLVLSTSVATTSASATGGTATIGFSTQLVAPFAVGEEIIVSGVTPTDFNGGPYTVLTCTTSQVTFALAGTYGPQTIAGTVQSTHNITGTGNIAITGNFTGTGNIVRTGHINLTGDYTNGSITISTNTISAVNDSLYLTSGIAGVTIDGIKSSNPIEGAMIFMRQSRGTASVPTTLQLNDFVAGYQAKGFNGADYVDAGIIAFEQDGSAFTSSSTGIPSVLNIALATASGLNIPAALSFNNSGVLSVPVVKVGSFATGSLPSSPAAGMIVYDSTTNQYKGYVAGTTNDWVVLG